MLSVNMRSGMRPGTVVAGAVHVRLVEVGMTAEAVSQEKQVSKGSRDRGG